MFITSETFRHTSSVSYTLLAVGVECGRSLYGKLLRSMEQHMNDPSIHFIQRMTRSSSVQTQILLQDFLGYVFSAALSTGITQTLCLSDCIPKSPDRHNHHDTNTRYNHRSRSILPRHCYPTRDGKCNQRHQSPGAWYVYKMDCPQWFLISSFRWHRETSH